MDHCVRFRMPRACGGRQPVPRQRRGIAGGGSCWETLKMTVDYTCLMREQARHAPPLGRAHTEPVNPGEVGCDRPERASASERAGYVT